MAEQPAMAVPAQETEPRLIGWLLVPIVLLVLKLLVMCYELIWLHLVRSDQDVINEIAAGGIDVQDPAWARLVDFEFDTNALLLAGGVLLLVLFFTRSWWYPRLFIVLLGVNLLISFFDLMLAHGVATLNDDRSFTQLIQPVIYCVIFIPYLLQSTQAKQTFVKHRPGQIVG